MGKGDKVNIAITLDSWVANWINQQPQKRSTLINQILKDHINSSDDENKNQKKIIAYVNRTKNESI